MAKNLKLNIKNAQLAEALQIGKIKKPPAKKKKVEEEAIATPPVEAVAATPAPEAAAPPPPPPAPPAVEVEKPKPAPIKKEEPPSPPSAPEEKATFKPSAPRPSYPPRPYPPSRPSYGPRPAGPGARQTGQGAAPGGYAPSRPAYRPYPPRSPSPGGGYRPGGRPPFAPRPFAPRAAPPQPPKAPPPSTKPRKEGAPGEAPRKAGLKDFRDVKPQKRPESKRAFDSRDRQGLRDHDEEAWRKRRPSQKMRDFTPEEVTVRPKELSVRIPISVKDLAVAMKLKASELLAKLFMQGAVLTLNDFLDDETTIQLLGHEFQCEIKIDRTEEERIRITDKTIKQEIQESPEAVLILRPPVVTFMGHVDHGKTSLIDKIRQSDIAAGEAGAITQHIGAFKCHTAVGDLTILDTPGHEAFSSMRTRGADVTDIVVLVIAGDEGMRTQTIEAMQQAQKANVPIVVALNKSDKPNFNADNVYRQLSEQNLLPEVWGGTTITVNCSAVTGAGIKELLEMLALQAEILEIKANPNARARGTVIESEMHKGMGPVATLLVQNGTLHIGDALVFDQHWARVKTMQDEHGKEMRSAGPSTPVKVTGLSGMPDAGSEFIMVKSEKEAQSLSYERTLGKKHALQQPTKRTTVEAFMQKNGEAQPKKALNLILRADVQGSLDALKNSLLKIPSTKVEINILSADVGEISESDVELAAASKAPIIGFHTKIASHADQLIKETKVTIKTHDIIYHAIDDVKAIMLTLLDKIPQETDTGTAVVKATFKASQLGTIAGCIVTDGTIKRSHHMRVIRDKEIIWKGPIASLRRVKEDVREVSKGFECGILLQNYNAMKEGDILQAYEITYLQQEL